MRLPAYAVKRTKRLVKPPGIFRGGTGVALHLGATAFAGAHLENLVLHDLLAWRMARAGLRLHAGRTVEWLTPRRAGGAVVEGAVRRRFMEVPRSDPSHNNTRPGSPTS